MGIGSPEFHVFISYRAAGGRRPARGAAFQFSEYDNVLLVEKHLLSLELQTRGLIERIYPVMVGDLAPSSVDGEPGVYATTALAATRGWLTPV